MTPVSGPTVGGTTITITGTAFLAGATVSVGGTAASNVSVASANAITATTPAGAAGLASVAVTNPGGASATLASAFTYVASVPPPAPPPASPPPAGPTVTGLTPTGGPTTGGTQLWITGSGFQWGATVTVGGAAATVLQYQGTVGLLATTPPNPAGATSVVITNPDGGVTTLPNAFTYVVMPPSPLGFTPSVDSVLGGTRVTVSGAGFQPGATVTLGGVPALGVAVSSPTALTFTAPAASAAGPAALVVTNPDGRSGAAPTQFTYVNGMRFDGIWWPVTSGPSTGGTTVTLAGVGFQAGATVTFNGASATGVTVTDPARLVAVTPPGMPGHAVVTVTNPTAFAGTITTAYFAQVASQPRAFYYGWGTGAVPGPTMPVAPLSGPAMGGIPVTLTGSGFQPGATVRFGAVPAVGVQVQGATTCVVTLPPALPGAAPEVAVTLTNPDGSSWSVGPPQHGFLYRAVAATRGGPDTEVPRAAVDGSGAVHVAWWDSVWSASTLTWSPSVKHRRSTDGGRTWSATTQCSAAGASVLAPRVAADGRTVVVAWAELATGLTPAMAQPVCAVSTDGGQTFGAPAIVAGLSPLRWTGPVGLDVGVTSAGAIVVAWVAPHAKRTRIYCATTTPGGGSGAAVPGSGAGVDAVGPDLAVDGATVHLAWTAYRPQGTASDIEATRSTDGGRSFANPVALTRTGSASTAAVAARGSMVVVGFADPCAPQPGLHARASTDGGATFGAAVRFGSATTWTGALAIDGAGAAAAAWGDFVFAGTGHWEIHQCRSAGGGASWSPPVNLTDNLRYLVSGAGRGYSQAPDVAAAGGRALTIWTDLHVAYPGKNIAAY